MTQERDIVLFTNINLKWIIDLNIKCKIIILEDNAGENIDGLRYSNDFLDMTSKT